MVLDLFISCQEKEENLGVQEKPLDGHSMKKGEVLPDL